MWRPDVLSARLVTPLPQAFTALGAPLAHPEATIPSIPPALFSVLHGMLVHQPHGGGDWFMDTGATSHMASNSGILSSSSALTVPRHIVVGNGTSFPMTSSGQALIPTTGSSLCLSNVLVAPHLIKNLISVRDLTRDNLVSVEFDPWGFSIKDLRTRMALLRWDSSGDLYPLHSMSLGPGMVNIKLFWLLQLPT